MPNRAAPKRKPRPRAAAAAKTPSCSSARTGRSPSAAPPAALGNDGLAEPLRALAEAAPSLLDALREIRSLVAPLAETVRGLERLAYELDRARPAAAPPDASHPAVAGRPVAGPDGAGAEASREIGLRIQAAQEAITAALVSLPRAEDYAPAAAQLRELASVSPSLMEWLTEVPRLSTPLAGSVRELKQAAAELEAARGALRPRR
jgi:hypothetical protein